MEYNIIYPPIPTAGVYYFATASKVNYEVRFGRKENDLLSATLVFGVLNDEYDGEEYTLTNKGEVFSVMQTIVKIISHFLSVNKNVRSLEFYPDAGENNSEELYNKRLNLYLRYSPNVETTDKWEMKRVKNKVVFIKSVA